MIQIARVRRSLLGILVPMALAMPAQLAMAQGGLLFQGVTDLQLGKTDSASALLARANGRLGGLARADLWSAIEPLRNLVLFGEVLGEAGPARDEPGNELYLRQYAIRFSPSDAFSIEAGKVSQIVGTFASRQLSTRNPLIGTPDGYSTEYPHGVRVDGSIDWFDYRAGLLSLPLYREGYVPDPSSALRPAIGFGVTPITGIRFGMSATTGPYLNDGLAAAMPPGTDWKSYKQTIIAADAQVSRGYFEGHAELAHSVYDIQSRTPIKGLLYYLEPKYTFTPRFFMALRYERNDYPFILPVNPGFWVANRVVFQDVELGGGFRATATSLIKLSVRADHWAPNTNPSAPHDNGYAVVTQWSQFFDFMELLSRQ
jgi:hypothetical protein